MQWAYLGQVDYQTVLDLQLDLKAQRRADQIPDTLILVEHPPVITLGRSADPKNILVSPETLQQKGIQLVKTERGGDVTYHGPGQLVGYPIRKIGRAIRPHVDGMISALRELLAQYDIPTDWRDDAPGIWTHRGKIAAIGVDARGGIAIHGFSLNISTRPIDYATIVPCGLKEPVTSMAEFLTAKQVPNVDQIAATLAPLLARSYGVDLVSWRHSATGI